MMLDHDVVEHESAHCAAAIILGLEVSRVDCVGDGRTFAGQLRYYRSDDDTRRAEAKTLLVADDIPSGYPPNQTGVRDNHDLVHLRRLIDGMRLDVSQYYALKGQAQALAESPGYQSLKARSRMP